MAGLLGLGTCANARSMVHFFNHFVGAELEESYG
jgi:hypothetical protein